MHRTGIEGLEVPITQVSPPEKMGGAYPTISYHY